MYKCDHKLNEEILITYLDNLSQSAISDICKGPAQVKIISTGISKEEVGALYHLYEDKFVTVLSISTEQDINTFKKTVLFEKKDLKLTIDNKLSKDKLQLVKGVLGIQDFDVSILKPYFPGSRDHDWFKLACRCDVPVLLFGESGVGKTVVAQVIHDYHRNNDKFFPVNLAAISKNILESELFGHLKGAYTGANTARSGLFSSAHNGTIFLDEITEVDESLQGELLRVISEESSSVKVKKLGEEREDDFNVRVIAATNRPIKDLAHSPLREDLLNRFPIKIELPSLREHIANDIKMNKDKTRRTVYELVQRFRGRFSYYNGGFPAPHFTHDAIEFLEEQLWPGNIRQLRNVVQNAIRFQYFVKENFSEAITRKDLQFHIKGENEFIKEDTDPLSIISSIKTEADLLRVRGDLRKQVQNFMHKSVQIMGSTRAAARILELHPETLKSNLKSSLKGIKI